LKADAVVYLEGSGSGRIEALRASAGGDLGRVVAVCDAPEDAAALRRADSHLVVLPGEGCGLVAGWNRGLFLRERDVLLLDGSVRLTKGSLGEMLDVLHASDRVASVVPLATTAGGTLDCAGVPRQTALASARGRCLLLRHLALNMIGAFDPSFENVDDALEDWSMRAARMGLVQLRANRARATGAEAAGSRPPRAPLLLARHPFLPQAEEATQAGPESLAVEHCLRSAGGPVRACTSLAEATAAEEFAVLHLRTPVSSARDLLGVLECRCHLVLDGVQEYAEPALLFAAAQSAQAVIAASEEERRDLVSRLALDPSRVIVRDRGDLSALYRRVVDEPAAPALRYRARMIDLLRSRLQGAAPSA
jgi:hypothetical protein